MKKFILILSGISVLFAILFGCAFGGVTIEDRIDMFKDELNKDDRSNAYTHFHPDTASYNQIKPHSYWELTPLATGYMPFDINLTSTPDNEATGQENVDADFYRENSLYGDCSFVMEKSGEDWYIRRFTLSSFEIYKVVEIID